MLENPIFPGISTGQIPNIWVWTASIDTNDISHKLVHIYTNLPFADEEVIKDENEMDLDTSPSDVMLDQYGKELYTDSIIRFASDYVKQEVTETLEEHIRSKLHTETNLSLKAGISNSLLGMSFEQIAHQVENFKTHSLEFNGVVKNLTINRQSEILEFFKSNISVISVGYWTNWTYKNYVNWTIGFKNFISPITFNFIGLMSMANTECDQKRKIL